MIATKKAANLSVRADLLEEARAFKINLSQTLEAALQIELKKEKERRWLEENRSGNLVAFPAAAWFVSARNG